jgi:hypothetical protein
VQIGGIQNKSGNSSGFRLFSSTSELLENVYNVRNLLRKKTLAHEQKLFLTVLLSKTAMLVKTCLKIKILTKKKTEFEEKKIERSKVLFLSITSTQILTFPRAKFFG